MRGECGESVGRVWGVCRECAESVWGECGESVWRVCGECMWGVGRGWCNVMAYKCQFILQVCMQS